MTIRPKDLKILRENFAAEDTVDILQDVRRFGSVRWVTRSRTFPSSEIGGKTRSRVQLMRDVLQSERVQETINTEAERRNWPKENVLLDAELVLEEMAHNFQLTAVRTLGLPLSYALKNLYSSVNTQPERWNELKELSKTNTIVFVPSHRSYLDFLLLSFLCFEFQVPLPSIAAGMDFMGMKLIGEMLRRSGAFFIRRQFGSDQLYWAVFTEYVQTQLRHSECTFEFFVEGTRSRTGKSLYPKFGLLTVLLEPYFRSQLYDVLLVPVSTSYERVVEESLFAYELIGFPKPKESTSGLLKAYDVLNEHYGAVHVNLAKPISVREYFNAASLHRNEHALEPNVSFQLRHSERTAIKILAHKIIRIQQCNTTGNIWPLICVLLLSKFGNAKEARVIAYAELLEALQELLSINHSLGYSTQIQLQHTNSVQLELDYYLQLHCNLIQLDVTKTTISLCLPPTQRASAAPNMNSVLHFQSVQRAVPRVLLCNYANECSHLYAPLAMLCAQVLQLNTLYAYVDMQALRDTFRDVQRLFVNEFVFSPDASEQESQFTDCVNRLLNWGVIRTIDTVDCNQSILELINESAVLGVYELHLSMYVRAYSLLLQSVAEHCTTKVTHHDLIVHYQQRLQRHLLGDGHGTISYCMFNQDLCRNALGVFTQWGLLTKGDTKGGDGTGASFRVHMQGVSRVQALLQPMLRLGRGRQARI